MSACGFYTIDSISDYFHYHTVTTIRVISENQPQFPTVSFCAYPAFNNSLDEVILKASFENVDIHKINYSSWFAEYNDTVFVKCFRFNSGERGEFLYSTSRTGLIIHLNLNVPSDHDFADFVISIHNHSSSPYDINNDGYYIKPGSNNYYELERVFTERLGEPYNDCLKDTSQFKRKKSLINFIMASKRVYSQTDCFFHCSHLLALEESHCSCYSSLKETV